MSGDRPTIAIFAQLTPAAGGIAQAVLGLIAGLGQLEGPESYVVVASPESADWLRPHTGANTRFAVTAEHLSHTGPLWQRRAAALLKQRAARLVPLTEKFWRTVVLPLQALRTSQLGPPASDGFIESLGADVVHFPYQRFIRTSLPSIFEPWDLQHRHLPQFFDRSEWQARDVLYREACAAATVVVTASEWVRRDIVEHYRAPASKVLVIRRGSVVGAPPAPMHEALVRRFKLPSDFALYPAQMLPHKNHPRLLEAIALLRDRDNVRVHLVCTGALRDYFSVVKEHTRKLRLDDQVTFAGQVSELELGCLYRRATLLVFPSLFEGYGYPLVEAMAVGLPIACSNLASLPEIAGDAARLFDPYAVECIASSIGELWRNAAERQRLGRAATDRVKLFDPVFAAERFRVLYRRLSSVGPVPACSPPSNYRK